MEKYFKTNINYYETSQGDKILSPFGPTIFQSVVDSNFTKELLKEGRKLTLKDDDWNPKLAGNLKYGRSYHYKQDFVKKAEKYLLNYVERYFNGLYEQYGPTYNGIERFMETQKRDGPDNRSEYVKGKTILDSLWINFSQKHDFNPPHTHSGKLSFVIFCKLPQRIFEVQADSNTQNAGNIIFTYGEQISELHGAEYPIVPYEDLIFIFPAKLKHYVPSYWVDEERISVSGNFTVVDK